MNELEFKEISMYDTKTQDDMAKYLERFTGSEKALAYLIYGLTWNMCAKMVNDRVNDRLKEEHNDLWKECKSKMEKRLSFLREKQ